MPEYDFNHIFQLHPRSTRAEFKAIVDTLPEEDLLRLREWMREGLDFDHIAVARQMQRAALKRVQDALPPIPKHLADYDVPEASGGRLYELTLNVDPMNADACIKARHAYIEELEQVARIVDAGEASDLASAWRKAKRSSMRAALGLSTKRERISRRRRHHARH